MATPEKVDQQDEAFKKVMAAQNQQLQLLKVQDQMNALQSKENERQFNVTTSKLAAQQMQTDVHQSAVRQGVEQATLADPSGESVAAVAASFGSPGFVGPPAPSNFPNTFGGQIASANEGSQRPITRDILAQLDNPAFRASLTGGPVGNILTNLLDIPGGLVSGILGGPTDPFTQLLGRDPTAGEKFQRDLQLVSLSQNIQRQSRAQTNAILPTQINQQGLQERQGLDLAMKLAELEAKEANPVIDPFTFGIEQRALTSQIVDVMDGALLGANTTADIDVAIDRLIEDQGMSGDQLLASVGAAKTLVKQEREAGLRGEEGEFGGRGIDENLVRAAAADDLDARLDIIAERIEAQMRIPEVPPPGLPPQTFGEGVAETVEAIVNTPVTGVLLPGLSQIAEATGAASVGRAVAAASKRLVRADIVPETAEDKEAREARRVKEQKQLTNIANAKAAGAADTRAKQRQQSLDASAAKFVQAQADRVSGKLTQAEAGVIMAAAIDEINKQDSSNTEDFAMKTIRKFLSSRKK